MSTLRVNTIQEADGTAFQYDYTKLDSGSGTSAGAALIFDNLDVTTYRAFQIVCCARPNDDNVQLRFRYREGGSSGSDVSDSSYQYGADYKYPSHNEAIVSRDGENYVELAENVGGNSEENFFLNLTLSVATSSDPGDIAIGTNSFWWNCPFRNHQKSPRFVGGEGHLVHDTSTYPTGFKLYMQSGNINAYTYTLWGLRR